MIENPRPKSIPVAPKSGDPLLRKLHYYSKMRGIKYTLHKSKSGRIYKRYEDWQRPVAGARHKKVYDWYIAVKIEFEKGPAKEEVLHIGAFYPQQVAVKTDAAIKTFWNSAISNINGKVVAVSGPCHTPGSTLERIKKITIVGRWRHKDGIERPEHITGQKVPE